MKFKYPLHNQVLTVLQALDQDFLASCETYFGGGTMLTLAYGEYRLSRDIDFLCPYGTSFSRLRKAIYDRGYDALFVPERMGRVQLPGTLKTDRDAVRFGVQVEGTVLKFEIVAEGRIDLAPPISPEWSPVACLSVIDQVAEKLLANGDRWADASTDSRDLIDLAILKQYSDFPQAAIDKAEAAYQSVGPLKRSILNFQDKPDYRLRCYERLQIVSPHEIANGLDELARLLELEPMARERIEVREKDDQEYSLKVIDDLASSQDHDDNS
jgi:hypothetical protein